jgi:hypothetical protein
LITIADPVSVKPVMTEISIVTDDKLFKPPDNKTPTSIPKPIMIALTGRMMETRPLILLIVKAEYLQVLKLSQNTSENYIKLV